MFSLLLLLSFAAFYCFYLSSRKIKIVTTVPISMYLNQHPFSAKMLGYALCFVSWIVFANLQGLGAGTFAAIVYFMAFGSLIILLAPYRYLNWTYIMCIVLLCSLIEFFVF